MKVDRRIAVRSEGTGLVVSGRGAVFRDQYRGTFRVESPQGEAGAFFEIGLGFGFGAIAAGFQDTARQGSHRSENRGGAKAEQDPDQQAAGMLHGTGLP
ncbi:MAG: hypothetical protein EOP83_04610 [Verrucomicrobiaceae bacterium]|nr:MAG: hypothetical protein EOP83_04610 [Verrucomicrobiaceae bacterium]